MPFWRILIVFLAATTLCACTSPASKETIPETFSTKITSDGTKLFFYQLLIKKDNPDKEIWKEVAINQQQRRPSSRKALKAFSQAQKQLYSQLELYLDNSKYCRDGYVEIEDQFALGLAAITGECKETATAEDKKSFPN